MTEVRIHTIRSREKGKQRREGASVVVWSLEGEGRQRVGIVERRNDDGGIGSQSQYPVLTSLGHCDDAVSRLVSALSFYSSTATLLCSLPSHTGSIHPGALHAS